MSDSWDFIPFYVLFYLTIFADVGDHSHYALYNGTYFAGLIFADSHLSAKTTKIRAPRKFRAIDLRYYYYDIVSFSLSTCSASIPRSRMPFQEVCLFFIHLNHTLMHVRAHTYQLYYLHTLAHTHTHTHKLIILYTSTHTHTRPTGLCVHGRWW
jgi:hypothetical protein